MTAKQKFIEEVSKVIETFSLESQEYFEKFKASVDNSKRVGITEKGKLILAWMRENKDLHDNMMKCKDVAEGLGLAGRVISGSFRKLVTDGYVEKIDGTSPIMYSITDNGMTVNLD